MSPSSEQQSRLSYAPKIALGLGLRMDRGPQYTAHQFLGESPLARDSAEPELRGRARMQWCHPYSDTMP